MYSSDDVVNISYHNVKNLCSNKHDSMNLDGLSNFFLISILDVFDVGE